MNNIKEKIINGSVPDGNAYIPVVIAHSINNSVTENIFFDGGSWRIYTNCEQVVAIRFYKCAE